MCISWRIVTAVGLIPGILGAQRMAPLPPPCALGGSNIVSNTPRRLANAIAVLPFAIGNGGARADYLAAGLPDVVAQRIGETMAGIDVLTRRAERRAATDDLEAIRGMGVELESRYLLTGTVTGSREAIRISVALYDSRVRKRIWQRAFVYDSLGASPIVRSISSDVAAQVAGSLTDLERSQLVRDPTRSRVAYDWLLRGEAAMDGAAYDRAANAFRQATRIDPAFADAFAKLALADAALLEEGIERLATGPALMNELRSAATMAVAGNPRSAIAWLSEARARLLEGRPVSSWRAAFERALALDGRDPAVLEEYGLALVQTEDRTAAHDILLRAHALVPRHAAVLTALADLAIAERKDGEACGFLNQAIATDALYGPAWATRALLRSRHGDLRFAWADAETASQIGSVLLGEAAGAIVDLKARDTSRAHTRLNDVWLDVKARGTVSLREGRAVATALIEAGEMSHALDVLEAVRPRGLLYAATLRDPNFDRARQNPRFRALVVPRGSDQLERPSPAGGGTTVIESAISGTRGFVARLGP